MSARFEELAYILHKRAYKESSYIIDLFTRNSGIVSVIAKGAKSNKSKFYLNLQLFSQLEVAFSGRSDLMTLTQADVKKSIPITVQKNIFCGYYVNELLLRLLHKHDQHQELFFSYERLMKNMADDSKPEPLLRLFEKSLLAEIGYGIDYGCTSQGDAVKDDLFYIVSPDNGITVTTSRKTSELIVSGKTLNDIESEIFSDENTLKESKQLMRRILHHHLGHKPLKSRDLFAKTAGH